jgi:hypothetical protein
MMKETRYPDQDQDHRRGDVRVSVLHVGHDRSTHVGGQEQDSQRMGPRDQEKQSDDELTDPCQDPMVPQPPFWNPSTTWPAPASLTTALDANRAVSCTVKTYPAIGRPRLGMLIGFSSRIHFQRMC